MMEICLLKGPLTVIKKWQHGVHELLTAISRPPCRGSANAEPRCTDPKKLVSHCSLIRNSSPGRYRCTWEVHLQDAPGRLSPPDIGEDYACAGGMLRWTCEGHACFSGSLGPAGCQASLRQQPSRLPQAASLFRTHCWQGLRLAVPTMDYISTVSTTFSLYNIQFAVGSQKV